MKIAILCFLVIIVCMRKSKYFIRIVWPLSILLILVSPYLRIVICQKLSMTYVLFSLLLGNLLFLFSCILVCGKNFHIALDSPRAFFQKPLVRKNLSYLCKTILTVFYEEMLFRGTIQKSFGDNYFSAVLVIIMFSTYHINKKVKLIQFIDITIFSAILSLIYLKYDNIWMTFILHVIRNINITLFVSKSKKC